MYQRQGRLEQLSGPDPGRAGGLLRLPKKQRQAGAPSMRPRRGISESAQHGPWPAPGQNCHCCRDSHPQRRQRLAIRPTRLDPSRYGLDSDLDSPGAGPGTVTVAPAASRLFPPHLAHAGVKIHPKFIPKFSRTLLHPVSPGKWFKLSGMLWIRGTTMFTMFGHGICVSWEYHQRR